MNRRPIWAGIVALLATACGSKDQPASDAGAAPSLHRCAPPEAAWVENAADDAGRPVTTQPLSCPGAIDVYCNGYAPACPPDTWEQAVHEFEMQCAGLSLYRCGAYNLADLDWGCGGDRGVSFFYDAQSGKLLAAVELSPTIGQSCLAGPSTMTPLQQCTDWFICDASGDGGTLIQTGGDATLDPPE